MKIFLQLHATKCPLFNATVQFHAIHNLSKVLIKHYLDEKVSLTIYLDKIMKNPKLVG